jgi:hypothetical protein
MPIKGYEHALQKYRPTLDDVRAAANRVHGNHPIPPTVSLLPGSRQMPDEDWRSYFERRKMKQSELEMVESFSQKQKRLAREAHSRTGEAPGKKGALVFYWVKHDSGFRFRRQVPRVDVAELWEEYAPTQRRYDGFTDEWDICTEFDSGAVGQEDKDEDEDNMSETRFAASPFPLSTDHLNMSVWKEVDHHYQLEIFSNPHAGTHDSALDVARYRYGLIIDCSVNRRPSSSLLDWDTAARALGCDSTGPVDPHLKHVISELVVNLLDVSKDVIRCPSKAIWDLDSNSDGYLFRRTNFNIVIRVEVIGTSTVYWLESRYLHPSRNAPWRLLVEDPATAIECLRRGWGPHLGDIAYELYSHGCAFKTCIVDDSHANLHRPAVIGLGYRLSGYVPLKRDYSTYESIRNNFLTTPRARVALLKGGIIWRLAKESVSEVRVMSGPSSEVYRTGRRIETSAGAVWDDDLSEDELNLISGVYKVFTGNFNFYFALSFKFNQHNA